MKKLFNNIGPGTLVAAAFIGPGTVTVCTLAGVQFGFSLLWAMMLSIVATIVLQEMAARLGLVHGKGLAETVKDEIRSPLLGRVESCCEVEHDEVALESFVLSDGEFVEMLARWSGFGIYEE